MVPDGGTASLGGVNRSYESSVQSRGLPSNQSRTSSRSVSSASVTAQIIDLDALDKELRMQASPQVRSGAGLNGGPKNINGRRDSMQFENDAARNLLSSPPTPTNDFGRSAGNSISSSRDHKDLKGNLKNKQADYEYLANLSHVPTAKEYSMTALEDTQYFLSQAALARSNGHWAAVEVYYQLAWQALPEAKKQSALRRLQTSDVDEAVARSKQSKANSGQKPSKNNPSAPPPGRF